MKDFNLTPSQLETLEKLCFAPGNALPMYNLNKATVKALEKRGLVIFDTYHDAAIHTDHLADIEEWRSQFLEIAHENAIAENNRRDEINYWLEMRSINSFVRYDLEWDDDRKLYCVKFQLHNIKHFEIERGFLSGVYYMKHPGLAYKLNELDDYVVDFQIVVKILKALDGHNIYISTDGIIHDLVAGR
jgi:hypothetical protein